MVGWWHFDGGVLMDDTLLFRFQEEERDDDLGDDEFEGDEEDYGEDGYEEDDEDDDDNEDGEDDERLGGRGTKRSGATPALPAAAVLRVLRSCTSQQGCKDRVGLQKSLRRQSDPSLHALEQPGFRE